MGGFVSIHRGVFCTWLQYTQKYCFEMYLLMCPIEGYGEFKNLCCYLNIQLHKCE